MRKILVPFDGSDNALRALRYAIQLAKGDGSTELHIVNAHDPPIVYGEVAVYVTENKAKEMQRRHSEDILKPAIKLATAAKVNFKSQIRVGDVAKSIVDYAKKAGCDGIVMGTRGMSAIGNLMLGSIATKVIHLTKLPVTLVK